MAYPPPGPGYPGSQPPYSSPPPPPPPAPPGPGYGSPYRNESTNGLAVAAFITGLLGCLGVLGIILGVIALSQIGRNGGRGRGLATAGIVLSSLWIVTGITVGVLAANSDSSDGAGAAPRVTGTKPKEVDAQKMKLGDCINDSTTAAAPSATEPVQVESVKIVPCTSPHDGEVTAVFRLPGTALPPESQLRQMAADGCKIRTRARISRDPAADGLANSYYYPTDESWRQGDRTVTCVAVAADEGTKLTRPLRR
ncbi:DUF4190 domain-containing protein [Actinomadura sp.]|jgi:hypothetical protein|uniref:DUF4190 domain-containing protein n=1 Tax=Actinomadura sp. TaxID=1989 RepID=UPI0033638EE3